jgi:hypothetical protein
MKVEKGAQASTQWALSPCGDGHGVNKIPLHTVACLVFTKVFNVKPQKKIKRIPRLYYCQWEDPEGALQGGTFHTEERRGQKRNKTQDGGLHL